MLRPRRHHASALAVVAAAAGLLAAPASAAPPAPPTAPVPTAPATPVVGSGPLAWAPPALTDPVALAVPDSGQVTHLDPRRDYLLTIHGTIHGTLHIDGGHDVVLVGGAVDAGAGRDGYFQGTTGTLHVEGVAFTSTTAHEGIDLAEPKGSTVQLEDLAMGQVNGSYSTHHADLVQSWAGPTTLRVDRLEGWTTYQGFFLLPAQHTSDKGPFAVDLRHVVTRDVDGRSKYHYWFPGDGDSAFQLSTTDVEAVKPQADGHTGQTVWSHRADVDVVAAADSPLLGEPGDAYTSLGYADRASAVAGAASGAPRQRGAQTTRRCRRPSRVWCRAL